MGELGLLADPPACRRFLSQIIRHDRQTLTDGMGQNEGPGVLGHCITSAIQCLDRVDPLHSGAMDALGKM